MALPEGLVLDTRVLPVLTRLTGCLITALDEAGIQTCFAGIVPGSLADSTPVGPETDSMLWVRQGQITPIVAEDRPNIMSCGIELQVDIEIGFLTCYPVEEGADPLDVMQSLELANFVSAAMMALFKGLACCNWQEDPVTHRKITYDVTAWTPTGPMGGVVGGIWVAQVIV